MPRRLLVVESVLSLGRHGIFVLPELPVDEALPISAPARRAELRRPDGSTLLAHVHVAIPRRSPPPAVLTAFAHFRKLTAKEVPIGTEVWMLDDAPSAERPNS
jgi:hypothetical protein